MSDQLTRSARASFMLVVGIVLMLAIPAGITLHTARVSAVVSTIGGNPSPYGYTISLLLFIVPIAVIGLWFIPREGVQISKKSFVRTIAILFPMGAGLDFFFAHTFFVFPSAGATLGISAPALGGGVPIEEYVFYLTGFICVLLMYIWFDKYWLLAYSIAGDAEERVTFDKLLKFHPWSVFWAVMLIVAAIGYKRLVVGDPGLPGYFIFMVLMSAVPSSMLFPSALPVVNWRAFSLTFFLIVLTSLIWEATLAVPYGWWGFRPQQMIGLDITAWAHLPIEEVLLWMDVTYLTVIVYEVVKRWQGSRRGFTKAMLGR